MKLLTKCLFFEDYDQGHFAGVFAPGQPKRTHRAGAVLPGFLPLVNPKTAHQALLPRVFCLVKPESCPSYVLWGFSLVDYRGYVALILEDMGPGFWNIWVRILEDMGPDSTAFGGKIRGNGAANRFLAYL